MLTQETLKLNLKTDEEIDDQYKRALFLGGLSEGKIPTRKNFFKNILYISGYGREFIWASTFESNHENYNRCVRIKLLSSLTGARSKIIKDLFETEKFIYSLRRYLNNKYRIIFPFGYNTNDCIDIHYNREDMMWSLLDYDLSIEHPTNTETRNNGFVYIKNYKR